MDALVAFLRARLDEDGQAARLATPGPWMWIAGRVHQEQADGRIVIHDAAGLAVAESEDLAHIARHDPARVLREVEAKRMLIDRALQYGRWWINEQAYWATTTGRAGSPSHSFKALASAGELVLKTLALPYADHPDYRQEWRP